MKSLVILLLVMLLSSVLFADNVSTVVNWEPALQYEDGSQLKWSEIKGYELHYTVDANFVEMNQPIVIEGSGNTAYLLTLDLPPRSEPYTLNVGLKTVSIYDSKSDMSNIISKAFTVVNTQAPKPPINIKLEIRCNETCTIVSQEII